MNNSEINQTRGVNKMTQGQKILVLGASGKTGNATAMELLKKGSFEIGAPNDAVLEMTGKPAEDFEPIIRRYIKNHDDVTRPTFGNKLQAIRGFIKLLSTGAVDLDKLEKNRMTA